MANRWVYIAAAVLLFLFSGFAALLGFLVGYFRKSPLIAALIGLVLGFVSIAVTLFSNPFGALFGLVFGFDFGQYIVGIVFSVGFAVIGWWLGRQAKGGRR